MRTYVLVFVGVLTVGTGYAQPAQTGVDTITSGQAERAAHATREGLNIEFSGFLRTRYRTILNDSSGPDFIGANDGFSLDNARFVADVAKERFSARISIDGAVDRRDAANTAVGRVEVGLRDGWVAYRVHQTFQLRFGQFKPDFDFEELQSTRDLLFIDRAVESRGVLGIEGFNTAGMSLPRQAGFQVFGRVPLAADFSLTYALSLTNGSGANQPLNDNEQLAPTARLALEQGNNLVLGGGFYLNRFSTGEPPDLITDEAMGWVVDFTYRRTLGAIGIVLNGQFMERYTTSVDVPNEPEVTARGYHGALGIELPRGFAVAYRYASFDPTQSFEAEDRVAEQNLEADTVTHHTMGVNYTWDTVPAKCQLNYTLAMESDERTVDNDRIDALVQLMF
ncbi:MAG: porin [Myxococcota bacterium]|nr:porin [Myxococcota bacterium]